MLITGSEIRFIFTFALQKKKARRERERERKKNVCRALNYLNRISRANVFSYFTFPS